MVTSLTTADIKVLIFQLPDHELLNLITEIEEKLATNMLMQLAETTFDEWNDLEEDIYDA
jgi:hypothetical protein